VLLYLTRAGEVEGVVRIVEELFRQELGDSLFR